MTGQATENHGTGDRQEPATDTAQSPSAGGGTPPGRWRQLGLPGRAAVAGVAAVALIAGGGLLWSDAAAQHAPAPRWEPASIDNLVLQAGPSDVAIGNGYPNISTRAADPRPLSLPEITRVFPPSSGDKERELGTNCGAVVLGRAVKQALASGGCSQVLRLVDISSDSRGAHYTSLIDIFNLSSGRSVYRVAREFGEKSPYSPVVTNSWPRLPPDTAPGGFIRPWPGTPAANMARAAGNEADIDGFGHFLIVIWSSGAGTSTAGSAMQGAVSAQLELILSQKFAENRLIRVSEGRS
jgi:hypothetical protein